MNKTSKILFRVGALVLILVIAALMFVIGRGHTVYLDNKTIEYNGQTYNADYQITIMKDGQKLTDLRKTERGMSVNIGQNMKLTLRIKQTIDGNEETKDVRIKLPYSMDNIIINLPAYLAGLPEEAYLTEFISAPEPEDNGDDELPSGDDFGFSSDIDSPGN